MAAWELISAIFIAGVLVLVALFGLSSLTTDSEKTIASSLMKSTTSTTDNANKKSQ